MNRAQDTENQLYVSSSSIEFGRPRAQSDDVDENGVTGASEEHPQFHGAGEGQ